MLVGLTASSLAVSLNIGELISLQIASLGFSWSLNVQCYYSVTNAFQLVFPDKVCIVRCVVEAHKSGMPCLLC